MGGIYVGIFILIIVLRYMAGRRPGTLADLTPRERFLPEKYSRGPHNSWRSPSSSNSA